jgi:hypothetical protein
MALAIPALHTMQEHNIARLGLAKVASGIMGSLRTDLTLALSLQRIPRFHSDAYLWVLMVGTCWELQFWYALPSVGWSPWFEAMLYEHAYRINCASWAEARAIIAEFLDPDILAPPGEVWFDELIQSGTVDKRVGRWKKPGSCGRANCLIVDAAVKIPWIL